MKMTEPETESNDVARTFPTISPIVTVRLNQIEGDSSPVIESSDHWSAESVWSDNEVDVTLTEQPEHDRGKVGGPAEHPGDCNLPALPRERGDWQLMPTRRTFRERVQRFFSVFIDREPPSERRGRSRDGVMMEEAGLPRGEREQELAIAAVEREFHDAAGYNAAYQEFETRMRYEEAEGPDGLMVDVLVGAEFHPEPESTDWGIFWLICTLMVEGVGGDCLYRCRRRLRKSCPVVFPLLVFTLLTSVSHHVHLSSIVQNAFLGPALYICIGAVTPYLFYRQAADDMNMSSVREKRIYALQATLTWFMPLITMTIWLTLFLPLATKAQSDARRTKIAFIALIVGRPLIGIATGTARFIAHGPPTRTAPLIFTSAMLYISVPRLIQARMESVEAKVVNSLIFATFDFLTDLFLPYGDIIKTTLWRHIKDKCISAANTSVMTLKRKIRARCPPPAPAAAATSTTPEAPQSSPAVSPAAPRSRLPPGVGDKSRPFNVRSAACRP
ncbi:unnamed protein product [Vitrella brassicaformis CCMP3155]|uniref:Uncharacterized protein n=1 Tax=Vitrella brassicaformis (strain CCMP3155) TaxID=1169540 RepID=A0A0G4H6A7_VITBC|nr:unnamed protein product [Vitrella brassicaformis CCMP3155]|eukprot:CEM39144.1 unnamed protein product [Vitrella brassicaformis CCMP3155]